MTKQVKSKKRVADHGEVFTAEREVNDMLDLVKQETERIDSRFLEPACGSGNFLVATLNRKLDVVVKRYKKSQFEFERYAILALTSIYGIDILEDNVAECRENLFVVFNEYYNKHFKYTINTEVLDTAKFIISKNIILGDALTLMRVDEPNKPIVFSEWSAVNNVKLKRRDYTLDELLRNAPEEEHNLFSDIHDEVFIPTPIKDYPLIHYLKVKDYE